VKAIKPANHWNADEGGLTEHRSENALTISKARSSATAQVDTNCHQQQNVDDSKGKIDLGKDSMTPAEAEGDDLIFRTGNQLREQRPNMVQISSTHQLQPTRQPPTLCQID
jgi:hypothetical protein